MSRKLLLFGGLSVASIATITPTGIHIHKEIEQKRKIEKARKERQEFIGRSDVAVNKLNEDSTNKSNKLSFLKDSDEGDRWKLMWIADISLHYSKSAERKSIKENLEYTKEEMNQFENAYWENQVIKQQGKWKKQIEEQLLKQVDSKTQYWEKFKEMCLILMVNEKIDKNENMNPSDTGKFLCVWAEDTLKTPWDEYQKLKNPKQGIMEYFWTVYFKRIRSTPSQSSTGK